MATLYRPRTPPGSAELRVRRSGASVDALLGGGHEIWANADAISWGPAQFVTTCRALWTTHALAVRFDARDSSPWHTMREHDDHLWEEEVVEVFLDPAGEGRNYAELEINPANVVCDLRMLSPWPEPRPDLSWHVEGLRTSVSPWNRGDDAGWTAVAWLPWRAFTTLSPAAAARVPPMSGERWRFNVFRIKRPHGPFDPERDAVYAAWSVPDAPSFHVPAAFRDLIFE